MKRDPLEKFRRALPAHVKDVEGHPYKAFEAASSPQRRLDLRPGYFEQRIVSYIYLTEIIHAGGVIVGLTFSTPALSVVIKGQNLQEMVDLLREEKVSIITEYVSEWHEKVPDDQPKIDSMQISEVGGRRVASPPTKQ